MDFSRLAGRLTVAVALVVWYAPTVGSEEPSTYRGLRLGMTVAEAAAVAGVSPDGVKTVFELPALIQELEWRPPAIAADDAGQPSEPDSVARVFLNFCDGELYRLVVQYDRERTEGLTEQDLIEALSAGYGKARRVSANIIISSVLQSYHDLAPVSAKWEDAEASINLFHTRYQSVFGLVIYSRAVAPVARAAIETSLRLARLDAPRRRIAEEQLRQELERLRHAKARSANKLAFRR